MRFGSAASGIEAASVAWKPLGFDAAWYSEIDPFCCSLLTERHGTTPNLGDMNDITTHALRGRGRIDCLVAGTPCQSFSVAGKRQGLTDPRGQLALRLLDILEWTRPRWLVWENVAGVLSSNGGRDFGAFLRSVAERGYGWSYRVLDAQFFGVPQRRRRVFVVGHLGDWRSAAAVLFERQGVPGDLAPSGKAKPDLAGTITAGSGRRRGAGVNPSEIVAALTACGVGTCGADDGQAQAGHLIAHTLRGDGFDASEDGTGRGTPLVPVYAIQERAVSENITNGPQGKGYQQGVAFTLEARHHVQAVAYRVAGDGAVYESGHRVDPLTTGTDPSSHIVMAHGQANAEVIAGQSRTLSCNHEAPILQHRRMVRRLTPRECERLQGFPDDYTLVKHRKKPAADGPRYKAIGNSIAIPVLRWIGMGLLKVSQ